jgi:hypothetical protein
MSRDSAVTTLSGPQESASTMPSSSAGRAWKDFARFLGRALVSFSILLFLLSGYVAFAQHWIQTQWTKSEATVLSGEIRQRSSGSTSRPGSAGTSSKLYYFHCVVSYPIAGETRQSELNSPASAHRIDAQVWGSTWSPRQRVAVLYKPSNPQEIRMAYNPAEITATGTLRVAFYILAPGLLLIWLSRSNRHVPGNPNQG